MMNKGAILIAAILLAGAFFSVPAQGPPEPNTPTVGDNATPSDTNIKMRSVELERVKRDAEKRAVLRQEDGKELNFAVIKEDFEGIQKEHLSIVEAYTVPKEIDYVSISKSADKITEMAIRLKANVFEPGGESGDGEGRGQTENQFVGKSVRDLIVALDNAIGDVVANPMWQKLAVIDPEASEKVRNSLDDVIMASGALWIEAGKMRSK
ncbi:MAG TPA: hypothetical protein VMM38_10580 [Aridibacter sp.]|nr:hypothetical protein [Aridibacter sp.]